MTGNFEYKKVCKLCGNTFVAQKSTTNYCSKNCASRGYKAEQKEKRRQADGDEIKERNRQNLLAQEYLSLCLAFHVLPFTKS